MHRAAYDADGERTHDGLAATARARSSGWRRFSTLTVRRWSGMEAEDRVRFSEVAWPRVPDEPGVYVIYDIDEVIYVGMAGRDGKGSLRNRLKDHASGQIVNMFAQYL